MFAIAVALVLISSPVVACATYLFVLALLSWRQPAPTYGPPRTRFDIVVPAHNEEHGIEGTVSSLLAVDYPPELRRVLVIADNCTDSTAVRAQGAGALVLVRNDEALRGKGYALRLAFERSLSDGVADAVVVVDADTIVSPNLLKAFAARFESGAGAVQAEYGVRNPSASWRTRLMRLALATFHGVRSLARERLGVSCGLRGNGMGFSHQVLREVPYDAFSIVEDLEYGIRLARQRWAVHYVAEAQVLGEMVSSERGSRSQRRRWEAGRSALAKGHACSLLLEGLARRDRLLLDMAIDLWVPPLTTLALAALFGTVASAVLAGAMGTHYWFAAWPWAAALIMIVLYVLRGVALSGAGARGLVDLAWAPLYIGWKLALTLSGLSRRGPAQKEWVRTTREGQPSAREMPR